MIGAVLSGAGAAVLLWFIVDRVTTHREVLALGLGAAAGMVFSGLTLRYLFEKRLRVSMREGSLLRSSYWIGVGAALCLFYGIGGELVWAASAGVLFVCLLASVVQASRMYELWRRDPQQARALHERSKEFGPYGP